MEIKLGDYARMIFESVMEPQRYSQNHWNSIREEATPLVKQLIALNDKMTDPYKIIGTEKHKLSETERIAEAVRREWECNANEIAIGDQIWIPHQDINVYDEPAEVTDISSKMIYVMYGYQLLSFPTNIKVIKHRGEDHPLDDRVFWLQKADQLGI